MSSHKTVEFHRIVVPQQRTLSHTFSAFWLRSSVVSVLISLISDTILIENEDINLIFGVAQVASGLPGLPVTSCLCIALQQSMADPARGPLKYKERMPNIEVYTHIFFFCSFQPISLHALAWYWAPQQSTAASLHMVQNHRI